MDNTDKAIDGHPTKIESILRIGWVGVLWVLGISFVLMFVGYGIGMKPNFWFWLLGLMVAYVAYVFIYEFCTGTLANKRKRTEHNPDHWSPS